MITKQDIIALAAHIGRRGRGIPDRRMMHPLREWIIGLVIAVIIAGFLGAYAVFFFATHIHGNGGDIRTSSDEVKYKEALVQRTLQEYRSRKERFDALGGGVKVAPAPAGSSVDVNVSATGNLNAE